MEKNYHQLTLGRTSVELLPEVVVVQPEEQPSVEVTKADASTAVEAQEELEQEPLEVVAVVASMVQAPTPVIVEQLAEQQEQQGQEER